MDDNRHRTTPRRLASWATAAALALALLAGPLAGVAAAHVDVATDDEPHPGTRIELEVRFDHACAGGEPTTELALRLPAGTDPDEVEPVEEDGWTATVDDRTVVWSGGDPVPDHTLHVFRVHLVLPRAPGETVYFPTVQRCGDAESAWIQVPEEGEESHDLDYPAPYLVLTDQEPPEESPAPEPSPEPVVTPDETDEADGGAPEAIADAITGDGPPWLVGLLAVAAVAVVAAVVLRARRGS